MEVRTDSGRGLTGLLVTMVVLAGMGAAVLAYSRDGSGEGHRGALVAGPGTTLTSSPSGAAGDIAAADAAACRAGYGTVTQAASYYETLNGRPPASLNDLASLLKDPAAGHGYTLSIDAAGRVDVATAGHPATPGVANCAFAS